MLKHLEVLYLHENKIKTWIDVQGVWECNSLCHLTLQGNPIAREGPSFDYRSRLARRVNIANVALHVSSSLPQRPAFLRLFLSCCGLCIPPDASTHGVGRASPERGGAQRHQTPRALPGSVQICPAFALPPHPATAIFSRGNAFCAHQGKGYLHRLLSFPWRLPSLHQALEAELEYIKSHSLATNPATIIQRIYRGIRARKWVHKFRAKSVMSVLVIQKVVCGQCQWSQC